MWDQHDSAESGGLPAAGNGYAQDSCEVNGYAQHSGELKPRKKGMSSLRVMLIAIAALVVSVLYPPAECVHVWCLVGSVSGTQAACGDAIARAMRYCLRGSGAHLAAPPGAATDAPLLCVTQFAGLLLYSQLVRYKPGLNQKVNGTTRGCNGVD